MEDGVLKNLLEGRKYPTDLLFVILFSILSTVCALILPDGNFLRIVVCIPLLLFFPGYCVVSALWPEKYFEKNEIVKDKGIDDLERLALSCGLSIAIISLTAFVLNYSAIGITLESSLIGTFFIMLLFSFVAYYRRVKIPLDNRFGIDFLSNRLDPSFNKTDKFIASGIGIALVISGISLGYLLFTPVGGEKYTEFYVSDVNSTTDNYPLNISLNEVGSVIIGVKCHESRQVNYSIMAGIESGNAADYANDWSTPFQLTYSTMIVRNITMNDGDVFEDTFSFSIGQTGNHKIVWRLYIDGLRTDYEVHLWVNIYAGR